MLKKIMLGIVAVVILAGVENLIAQEETDRPKTEPGQRQGLEGRQRQRARAEQIRGRQAASEAEAKHAEAIRKKRQQEALQKKRLQEAAKRAEALQKKRQQEALQKRRQQETAQKGAPRARVSRELQQSRPGQNLPMQPMLGGWLNELTKAYRENDRQEMGQLIRRMQQVRQKWQKARAAAGQGGQGFRERAGIRMGQRPGVDIAPRGMRGRRLRLGGMGGWGRGWQGRGMGRWGRGRGICPWGRGFQGRGMGRPGPGMPPPTVVDRPGPPMPPEDVVRPDLPMPPEDVVRPMLPMRRRDMGRQGWGISPRISPERQDRGDAPKDMERRDRVGRRGDVGGRDRDPEPRTTEPGPRRPGRRAD